MKHKVRIENQSGFYESETDGTSDEFREIFGDAYAQLLTPASRFNPPAPQPVLPPEQYQATVIQPPQIGHYQQPLPQDKAISDRLLELEQEVNAAETEPVPISWEQQLARTQIYKGQGHAVDQAAALPGDLNPLIRSLRAGAAGILVWISKPSSWIIDLPLLVVMLAAIPFTRPIVSGVPLIGKSIVSGVQFVGGSLSAHPAATEQEPEDPKQVKPTPKHHG